MGQNLSKRKDLCEKCNFCERCFELCKATCCKYFKVVSELTVNNLKLLEKPVIKRKPLPS